MDNIVKNIPEVSTHNMQLQQNVEVDNFLTQSNDISQRTRYYVQGGVVFRNVQEARSYRN